MSNTTNKQNIPTTSNLMEQIEATLKTLSQFDDVVFQNLYVAKKIKIYQSFFKDINESLSVINDGLTIISQYLIKISEIDINNTEKLDKKLNRIVDSLIILNSYSSYIFSLISSITSVGLDDIIFNLSLLNINIFTDKQQGSYKVKNILEFYAILTDFLLFLQNKIEEIKINRVSKNANKLLKIALRLNRTLRGIITILYSLPGKETTELLTSKIDALEKFAEVIDRLNKLNLVGTMFNAITGFISIFIGVKTIYDIVTTGKANTYLYKGGILVKVGTVDIGGALPGITDLWQIAKSLTTSILLFSLTTVGMVPVYKGLEIIKNVGIANSLIGFYLLQKGIFEMYKFILVLHMLFSKGQYYDKKTGKLKTIGLLTENAKKELLKHIFTFSLITTSVVSSILVNTILLKNISKNFNLRTFITMHLMFWVIKFLYSKIIDLSNISQDLSEQQLVQLIKINTSIIGVLFLTNIIANVLRQIGVGSRQIRRGLRVFYNIYGGNIVKSRFTLKTPSIIQTIESIGGGDLDLFKEKAKNALTISAYLVGFMALTSLLFTPLLIIGSNFLTVIIGLKALKYLWLNLSTIIEFIISVNETDLITGGKRKDELFGGKTLALLKNVTKILFYVGIQAALITAIGTLSPVFVLAIIGMRMYFLIIKSMVKIITYLALQPQAALDEGSGRLIKLTGYFAAAVEMIGAILAGMMSIEITSVAQGMSILGGFATLFAVVGILVSIPIILSKIKVQMDIGLNSLIKLALGILMFTGLLFLINNITNDINIMVMLHWAGSVLLLLTICFLTGLLAKFTLPLMIPLILFCLAIFSAVTLLSAAISIAQKTNTEDASQKLCNIVYAFFDPIGLLASIPLETLMTAGFKAWRLKRISMHLSEMAKYISDIANLTIATKWDKYGNPIEYRQMKPDDFQKAVTNANNIANTIVECITGIQDDKIKITDVHKFRRIKKISRQLSKMAEQVANIASLKFATKWNKDCDPIEFKAMNKDMFKLATENSLEIVKTIINAVVGVDGEAGLDLDAISKKSVKKFRQIKRISNQLAKMASNVASIASLKYATKWDEEGNPIEYAQMTEQMFLDATTNAMAIVRTVATTLSNKEITKFLNKEFDNGKENIRMIGEMGNAVGGMVQGIISLKEGKIAEYDLKTGEVIGYKTVSDLINDEKARTELGTNLQQLLGIYVEAVTNDKIWDAAKGDTWFTSSKIEAAEKLFERLNTNIIPGTNSIISGIVELQKNKDLQNLTEKVGGNQTKADLMKANLSALLGTYVDTVANIDTSKIDDTKISSLNKIGNLIDKFNKPIESSTVEGQKKILENISKFIDKANTVNTDKIKSTADMFMQMAKISESIRGNFDGLAEALNDNLMEVLEELRDILKETNGIIDTNKATSTSNNSTSVSQMYQHQLVQPSTSQDTQKAVDMTPVIEKLEGLLQAFKGGVPVYNKVGTRLQINTTV